MRKKTEDIPAEPQGTAERVLVIVGDVAKIAGSKLFLAKALRGGPVGIALAVAQVLFLLNRHRKRRKRARIAEAAPVPAFQPTVVESDPHQPARGRR